MTVSITTSNGNGYTWAGSTWDWTDVRAGKAWDNTFSNAYTCTEADTAPNFAASRPKDVAKAAPYEAFATTDAYADVVAFARSWSEAFATVEVYQDNIQWLNDIQEVFAFAELLAKAADRRNLLEAFATAELPSKDVGKAHLYEAFATAESQTDVVAFARGFASSWATAEDRADVVAFNRNFAESLATAEGNAKDVTNRDTEAFSTSDAYSDVIAFARGFAETLDTAVLFSNQPTKGIPQSLAFLEVQTDVIAFVREFADALSFTEVYFDNINWLNAIEETLGFTVLREKFIANVETEAFLTTDALVKAFTNVEPQTLAIGETYTDLIAWIQANVETVNFAEASPTTIAKNILRQMAFRDMFLRNATGVFGDLSVRSSALSSAQFAALLNGRHPEGFGDFKQYLPGDYRFQKALVNIALVPTDAAGQTLSLQSARTTVDVPDVNDRGSETLTTAGKTVTFARTFYTAPEIKVQQTGGSGPAVAMVSSVTANSFFVRLYDAANPTTPVSGSISWSALGY